jgi:hypothetical protein
VSLNEDAYEPFEPVYHEYVHYLTRRLVPHWPLWLVEGFAEFYGNIRIKGDQVFIGAPSTSHMLFLQQTSLLPISTLFDANSSSPYYNEKSKTSIFYAESWALTHYLTIRDAKVRARRGARISSQTRPEHIPRSRPFRSRVPIFPRRFHGSR